MRFIIGILVAVLLLGAGIAFYLLTGSDTMERDAEALLNKGVALGDSGEFGEAIKTLDDLVAQFGETEKPEIKELVVSALVGKSGAFIELEQYEEAIKTLDDMIIRFGEEKKLVAMALVGKGMALQYSGKPDEAIKTLDDMIAQFSEEEEPEIKEWVAGANSILTELKSEPEQ